MDLAVKNSKLGAVYTDQGGISWHQEDPRWIILIKVAPLYFIYPVYMQKVVTYARIFLI